MSDAKQTMILLDQVDNLAAIQALRLVRIESRVGNHILVSLSLGCVVASSGGHLVVGHRVPTIVLSQADEAEACRLAGMPETNGGPDLHVLLPWLRRKFAVPAEEVVEYDPAVLGYNPRRDVDYGPDAAVTYTRPPRRAACVVAYFRALLDTNRRGQAESELAVMVQDPELFFSDSDQNRRLARRHPEAYRGQLGSLEAFLTSLFGVGATYVFASDAMGLRVDTVRLGTALGAIFDRRSAADGVASFILACESFCYTLPGGGLGHQSARERLRVTVEAVRKHVGGRPAAAEPAP